VPQKPIVVRDGPYGEDPRSTAMLPFAMCNGRMVIFGNPQAEVAAPGGNDGDTGAGEGGGKNNDLLKVRQGWGGREEGFVRARYTHRRGVPGADGGVSSRGAWGEAPARMTRRRTMMTTGTRTRAVTTRRCAILTKGDGVGRLWWHIVSPPMDDMDDMDDTDDTGDTNDMGDMDDMDDTDDRGDTDDNHDDML
jgi:hypothetical protein